MPTGRKNQRDAGATRPRLTLIAAIDRDHGIGRNGTIPWTSPEDMRQFRARTMGGMLVMGRVTWQSIARALPGRTIVVLASGNPGVLPDGVLWRRNLTEALDLARLVRIGRVFAAGGRRVYLEALANGADDAVITHIPGIHGCDATFPYAELQDAMAMVSTETLGGVPVQVSAMVVSHWQRRHNAIAG